VAAHLGRRRAADERETPWPSNRPPLDRREAVACESWLTDWGWGIYVGKTRRFRRLPLGGDCCVSPEVTVENLTCLADQFGLGERFVEQDDARLQPSL
jgi:hypothetical protein